MGNYGSVEHIPAMKWYFNVLIVCSARLRQCIPWGASWNSMLFALSYLSVCRSGLRDPQAYPL